MSTPLENWQIQDAARLKALFNSKKPCSQLEFGQKYGIGSQGMVWQYLSGKRALNLQALIKFGKGLNVSIEEISPKLAAEIPVSSSQLPINPLEEELLIVFRSLESERQKIELIGYAKGKVAEQNKSNTTSHSISKKKKAA